jgi:DNA mismatch repair protein MutS2
MGDPMKVRAALAIEGEALAQLGWETVTDALARRCATARGEERAALLAFAPTLEEARDRIADIDEARRLLADDAALSFAGITDVDVAAERAAKGSVLAGEELVAVADTARALTSLRRHLARHQARAPRLAARASDLTDLEHLHEPILGCFEPGPRLVDHASVALGPLRRKAASLASELDARAQRLLDDPELSRHLQDRFTTQRHDRYVVPIKASAQAAVKGIVHGTSQSGQTVFIEPEAIVSLTNRLVIAEAAVADEERRILAELSARVGQEAEAIRAGLVVATELDLIAAGARLAEDLDASPPVLAEGAPLRLQRARNPQMLLMAKACVPNDIVVEPRTTLLISGPNAGGKTVALKTAGLAAAMAHAGLHVAADARSSVPWLSAVYAHLGDAQSVDRDLSTFSAQIADFVRFVERADERTLVLLDEVAVGTDPEQGAALAQALLEALADRGASGIVTTHYERLKALPPHDERFANASVGFDMHAMQPTFELHLGLPGASGAFAVARRHGLAEAIVCRAEALAGSTTAGIDELLAEIAGEHDAIEAERRAIERERAEVQRARARADDERRELRKQRKNLETSESAAAVVALRRARAEVDRVRAELKRAKRQEEVAAAERRIDLAWRRASRQVSALEEGERPARAGVPPEALAVGTEVFVPRFGRRGRVVEPPSRKRVMVQVGALRTHVSLDDLELDVEPPAGASSEGRARAPQAASPAAPREPEHTPVRTPDLTLDLRGYRIDDALGELDRFLDQALLSSRAAVFVLHGHGTGALRRAIRDHLEEHPATHAWHPAGPEDGGDGVTVAWLDVA